MVARRTSSPDASGDLGGTHGGGPRLMFIVSTFVAPSAIHGMGCFAGQELKPGEPIWQFARGLDLVVPFDQIAAAPKAFQDYMEMYAYVSPQVEGDGAVLRPCQVSQPQRQSQHGYPG